VRLAPTRAKWLSVFSWVITESTDGDYVIMSFMVDHLDEMTTGCCSFGSMAEVLSPESFGRVSREVDALPAFNPRAAVRPVDLGARRIPRALLIIPYTSNQRSQTEGVRARMRALPALTRRLRRLPSITDLFALSHAGLERQSMTCRLVV